MSDIFDSIKKTINDEVDGPPVAPQGVAADSDPPYGDDSGPDVGFQTGRGPTGRLRNFKAMNDGKLESTYAAVADEDNDPEALDAILAQLADRGLRA